MRSSDSSRGLSGLARRIDQRGGAQWLTYLLIIGVVVGGYLLWVYAPYYLDNYKAKSKCDEVLNETWRHKDAEKTRARLFNTLKGVSVQTIYENGEKVKVPAIDPLPQDVQVEIDNSSLPPVLSVNVDYSRTIVFPLLKKSREQWFNVRCELTLEEVNWE